MTEMGIVARLRALVALDRPESGGPYGGYAASMCMEAMREAATALETLQRERDEAVRIAKDTAVALTGLTPGGSEYCSYSRMLDTYFADIEACVGAVRRRYEDGHSARLALVEMRKERDEAREALRPFAQVLVYSFEDDPGKIHVTYAGETLTVLELDSDKGSAALKLEQDLAKARATLTQGG